MTDTPITHVMDTAFWVATHRANESERPDALFRDPLAARLVEGRGRVIAAQMSDQALTAWSVVLRTRMIDEIVAQAVAEGCDTVVNLGAGLDTRPYRLPLPSTLPWIEVDFADTIAFKQERLAGETPRCRLRRVAVDLSDATARAALFDDIDASAKRVLVLTEGVILYLSNEDVAALADDLRARPCFERWLVEYFAPGFFERSLMHSKQRLRQLANAPMKFKPGDWDAFFGAHGWKSKEIRYHSIEAARLKRRPPITWKMRLRSLALPKQARERLRHSFGYAVLERS